MKTLKSITAILLLFAAVGSYAQSSDTKIIADAEKAKQKMLERDQGLQKYFDNSSGYVIFPNIGEGGLIIGAASGKGVVYENGSVTGIADMKKVDVGAQVGGQALAEVIFFETEDALNEFKADKYAFSAEVSAVALESGASKNSNYNDGVVVFTMPKAGMMADASIGGQKFEYSPIEK
jgi:lipid-binding SYLF domain-containing protein